MNEKQRAQLIAEQTLAFVDEQFASLDLSGSPSLQKSKGGDFGEDSHGLNRIVESGANHLKAMAENPDLETIQRIAEETGDPELVQRITDDVEGQVAEEFVRTHRNYYKCDENYGAIREWLAERGLDFNAGNLDLAFKTLTRAGQLEMRPGTAKTLDESEILHVINLCKSGDLDDAVSQFLTYSLPGAERLWSDQTDFVTDPDTVTVRNNACRFVWYHANPVDDSPALRNFERQYFRSRPIKTIDDYQRCYELFQKQERAAERNQIIYGSEPVSRDDLNNLSDDQVDTLTQATLRKRARELVKLRGNRVTL